MKSLKLFLKKQGKINNLLKEFSMYKDRGLIESYRQEQEFINVFLHNNKSLNVELKYTYLQVKSRLSYWKIIKTGKRCLYCFP